MTTLESFPSVLIIRTSCAPLDPDDGRDRRRPRDTTIRTKNGSTTHEFTKLPFATSATTGATSTSTATISAQEDDANNHDTPNTDKDDNDDSAFQNEEDQEDEYRPLLEDFQATLPLSCDITVIPELQDFVVDFSSETPPRKNNNDNDNDNHNITSSSHFTSFGSHQHHHDTTASVDKRRGTDPILEEDISTMLQLSQQPLNPCGSDNVLLLPELVSDSTLASTLLQGGFLLSLTNCHATFKGTSFSSHTQSPPPSLSTIETTANTTTTTSIPIQASPSTYSFHLGDNDIMRKKEAEEEDVKGAYPSSTLHSSSSSVGNSHGAFAALTIDFDFNAQQDILREYLLQEQQQQQQAQGSLSDFGSNRYRHDNDDDDNQDTSTFASSTNTTMGNRTTTTRNSSTDRHTMQNPTLIVPEACTIVPDHNSIVSLVNNVVIREQEYLESLLWRLGLVVVLLMMMYVWLAFQLLVVRTKKATKKRGPSSSTTIVPQEEDGPEEEKGGEHSHKETRMILVDGTTDTPFWKTKIIYGFAYSFGCHVSNRWNWFRTKITTWYSQALGKRTTAAPTTNPVRTLSSQSPSSSASSSSFSSLWDDKSSSNATMACTTHNNVNNKLHEKGEKDGNNIQKTQSMTDDDVYCTSTGKKDDDLSTTRTTTIQTTQSNQKEEEEEEKDETQTQVDSCNPHHVDETNSFVGATTSISTHCQDELPESKDSTRSSPPMTIVTLEHPILVNRSPLSPIADDKRGQDSKSQNDSSNNFRSSTTPIKVGLPSEQQQQPQVLSRTYVQHQQPQQQQKAKVTGDPNMNNSKDDDLIVGSSTHNALNSKILHHDDDDCENSNKEGGNNIMNNSNLSPCTKLKRNWQESKHHRRSSRKGRKENSLSPCRPLIIRTPTTTPSERTTKNNNHKNNYTLSLPETKPMEQSKTAKDSNGTNSISPSTPDQVDATPPLSVLLLETPSTNDTNSIYNSEIAVPTEQQQRHQCNTGKSARSAKSNQEDLSNDNHTDSIHPQEAGSQQKQQDEKVHTLQARNLDSSFLEDYWEQ